jgi:hypothetical protein
VVCVVILERKVFLFLLVLRGVWFWGLVKKTTLL